MKKNLIVLVVLLVVLSMVLSACSSSPSTSASLSSTDITVGDVVEINQMFPPIINWEDLWKDSLNGEAGRAPSQAEMLELVASLEDQGMIVTASTEENEKAFEILQNGGVLVLTVMSPIPGDEIVIIGNYLVQGVKFFVVAVTSVMAIRTVGNLTIPQLKEKTRHTLWTHDVLSMDAQTYIRTLTGSPNDKNLMCAIVKMTSGATRYVMAQKVMPHLNQAIFAWYSEAAWGGAYLIDTNEFPASSADVASFSSILCDQLPPPPPLPQ